jgi:glycogen debranching enzyme
MYRMSQLLRQFGEIDHADDLRRRSSELAKKIDKAFWMSQENYYAMALDAHKHKVEVVSSNPGHLLFARAVTRDRARAIVDRVMKEDMNSGWGIRTVSRSESTFNPLSYHRGSLWPHDNSLIAYGMSLYGFREEVNQIFTSLFQAAQHIRDYRLPELFCGMQRREYDSPVAYPVSCSPQAWASGTFFLLLGAVLGLRPSAARKELNIVNPVLPTFLDHLRIENLQVGQSRASLEFTRRGDRTFCNVIGVEGEKLLINVAFRK